MENNETEDVEIESGSMVTNVLQGVEAVRFMLSAVGDSSDWPLTNLDSEEFLDASCPSDTTENGPVVISTEDELLSDCWYDPKETCFKLNVTPFTPVRSPGFQLKLRTQNISPLDIFQLFFDVDIVTKICKSMEGYVEMQKHRGKLGENYQLPSDFGPTCFYQFMGILIFMGLFKCPNITDYFQNGKSDFPFVWKLPISARGFQRILHCLHFTMPEDDLEIEDLEHNQQPHNRILKVKILVDHIRKCCQEFMAPSKELSIHERTSGCKADIPHSERQCQVRAGKWGFKLWVVTSVKNGYVHNFELFFGSKEDALKYENGLPYTVAQNLMKDQLNCGHVLFMDDHFMSQQLFEDLVKCKTYCVGGVSQKSRDYPRDKSNALNASSNLGDSRWYYRGGVIYSQWRDATLVTVASTYHSSSDIVLTERKVQDKQNGQIQNKPVSIPQAISEYWMNMRGHHLPHQVCGNEEIVKNTARWYAKFFLHCLDVVIINSFVIFDKVQTTSRRPRRLSYVEFRSKLAQELCSLPSSIHPFSALSTQNRASLHKIIQIAREQYCVVCLKASNLQKTTSICEFCRVALCSEEKRNCSIEFHKSAKHRLIV